MAEIEQSGRRKQNPHIEKWQPIPDSPQDDAFNCEAFEVLYGGAAGGGKSSLLLGLSRYRHKASLLLRRTFPQLEDSLILKSKEFFDQNFYNGGKHVWSFPDNKRIRFGHLEYDKDVYQYQSAEFDLIGFDELTQFTKMQYQYMISRARTTDRKQTVQVFSCTNPGGEGNDWVMERWAPWLDETYPNPAKPGEIRWFKRGESGSEEETAANDPDALSRTYIPARLKDNPYLDDEYRKRLQLLPEPLRSQLLNGDWKAGQIDDAYQVIPREWIKAAMERWRNSSKPTWTISAVGVDCARGGSDKHVIAERRRNWFAPLRKFPGAVVKDGDDALTLLHDIPIGDAPVNIDVIGIGSSVYDSTKKRYKAVPVNVAEGADENKTDKSGLFSFVNKRAQYAWELKEALDPNSGIDLMLPDDQELLGDLSAMRYKVVSNRIKIELKEEIKSRLGRSPDCGEAVILANANTQVVTGKSFFHSVSRTQAEAMGVR